MTPNEIIEIIQAWKDGKRLQCKRKADNVWLNYNNPECPKSFIYLEYRIRPSEKTKVKYYKFLCRSFYSTFIYDTNNYYKTSEECKKRIGEDSIIQRIDNSMIEIEEDS